MPKRITKVTTKKGDDGSTSIAHGKRVSKSSSIVDSIGEIDELNSWIGLLSSIKELDATKEFLLEVQNTLFDIGGILATSSREPLINKKLEKMESNISEYNKQLPHLDNFVLPSGSRESSIVHITRSVCRRAERSLVRAGEDNFIEKSCVIYLNRLSDFLFILARKTNLDLKIDEILWKQE